MKESIKKIDLLEMIRHHYIEEQPEEGTGINNEVGDDIEQNPEDQNNIPQRSNYKDNVHDTEEGSVNYTGQYHRKMPIIKLRTPKFIDTDTLIPQGKHGRNAIRAMVTKDPRDGKTYEGGVVTDEVIETPNGEQLYLIKNYGDYEIPKNANGFTWNYIEVQGGRKIFTEVPIRKGLGILKPDKYADAVNKPRSSSDKHKYSKRLISSRINVVFNSPDLKKKLDSMMMSPVVGDYRYTEMRTNVLKEMVWGVDTPELKFSYNGVIQTQEITPALKYLMSKLSEKNINVDLIPELDDDFINDIFDIGADVEEGDVDLNNEKEGNILPVAGEKPEDSVVVGQHKRRGSSDVADYMTRYQAGHIYKNGKWNLSQRVGSAREFEKAGGRTKVRGLYSKDIQLGEMSVASMSELSVTGNIEGNEYVLRIIFEPYMSIRPKGKDNGVDIGDLITPIDFTIRKELPEGLNEESFNLGDSTNDETVLFMTGNEGVLTTGLQKLKYEIINLNQEEVINHIVKIFEQQIGELSENKKPTIVLTEVQVKKLLTKLNEEGFDSMITNYNKGKEETVPIPNEIAMTLFNIAKDWCQKRPGNSDCEEISNVRDSLNLY